MLNYTVVQGRLVADPELRMTQTNVPVCSFAVAWSEKFNDKETTLFLNCVAWRSLGEFINKNFQKGKQIVVDGKLNSRSWTDKDGKKHSTVELTVSSAHFCGVKTETTVHQTEFVQLEGEDDFLPF